VVASAGGGQDALERALSSGDPARWAEARERVARPALVGADLSGAALADFDLGEADLTNADLSDADLTAASLDGATLDGADLTSAKLLEVEVKAASFQGAALDEAQVGGTFADCNFSGTSWDGALVRGARFVRCDFTDAEIDVERLARANRFDSCSFGDREDLPESLREQRPGFLRPPLLEGERVRVTKLVLAFPDEPELRREVIGAATGAGWEPEMVAILKHEDRLYAGLRPEPDMDELEEWIAFAPVEGGGLAAVEIVFDPAFDTFLEELVVPMLESARGDLAFTAEQDMEDGRVAITEVAILAGVPQPTRQSTR
jgi:hypothetical protein